MHNDSGAYMEFFSTAVGARLSNRQRARPLRARSHKRVTLIMVRVITTETTIKSNHFRRRRTNSLMEKIRSRPGKPNQRKGQNEKFMNFAHFCEFWCFSLGKQAQFTVKFCSGMSLRKVHELAFLWFGLPGPLLKRNTCFGQRSLTAKQLLHGRREENLQTLTLSPLLGGSSLGGPLGAR